LLNKLDIEPPQLVVTKARVEAKSNHVFSALQMSGAKTVATLAGNFPRPNLVDLYLSEQLKIKCGSRHFNGALHTDFKLIDRAEDLPGGTAVG
jgi:hypothetical protein